MQACLSKAFLCIHPLFIVSLKLSFVICKGSKSQFFTLWKVLGTTMAQESIFVHHHLLINETWVIWTIRNVHNLILYTFVVCSLTYTQIKNGKEI